MNPIGFLLNRTSATENEGVVSAPAFSLTKVMAIVAPLITALVSTVLSRLDGVNWTTTEYVWMIVSLVAFLAVTSSTDVLARAIAASAKSRAAATTKAAETRAEARGRIIRFSDPLPAFLPPTEGNNVRVRVIAASNAQSPEFLCVHDDNTMTWEPDVDVTFRQQQRENVGLDVKPVGKVSRTGHVTAVD
jgi:hypothetical protein